ncbi:SRPBCC family protein [Streptomyces sp. NPDC050738]|uniref:SRPBCC family protein n=1 Tax=Streptomyces sp. NPDC050738 TaxID=3154744 RepID=UPI0034329165
MRAQATTVLPFPLAEVWATVSAFDDIALWHPLISTSEGVGGGGPASGPGRVRRLTTIDQHTISERLVAVDEGRSLTYEFVDSPFPVTGYRAAVHLAAADGGTTEAWWVADFIPDDPRAADELAGMFTDNVFVPGLKALGEHLRTCEPVPAKSSPSGA